MSYIGNIRRSLFLACASFAISITAACVTDTRSESGTAESDEVQQVSLDKKANPQPPDPAPEYPYPRLRANGVEIPRPDPGDGPGPKARTVAPDPGPPPTDSEPEPDPRPRLSSPAASPKAWLEPRRVPACPDCALLTPECHELCKR